MPAIKRTSVNTPLDIILRVEVGDTFLKLTPYHVTPTVLEHGPYKTTPLEPLTISTTFVPAGIENILHHLSNACAGKPVHILYTEGWHPVTEGVNYTNVHITTYSFPDKGRPVVSENDTKHFYLPDPTTFKKALLRLARTIDKRYDKHRPVDTNAYTRKDVPAFTR